MTIAPVNKYGKQSISQKSNEKKTYQKNSSSSSCKKAKTTCCEPNQNKKSCQPNPSKSEDSKIIKESNDGNNSADEYSSSKLNAKALMETNKNEINKELEDRGLKVLNMKEDGSCLFRSIAQQIYGDQEMHSVVREKCLNYIEENWNFFKDFVTEDKSSYLERKHNSSCHGNHLEIAAMSYLYNTKIEIYTDENVTLNTFDSPTRHNANTPPLRLMYRNNNHYDAIVDCRNPLINSHLANCGSSKLQRKTQQSTESNRTENIVEDSYIQLQLKQADWEDTESEIIRRVEQESILQWHKHNVKNTNSSKNSENTNSTSIHSSNSPSPKSNQSNIPTSNSLDKKN